MLNNYITTLVESRDKGLKTNNDEYTCCYHQDGEFPLQLSTMTLQLQNEALGTPKEHGIAAIWYSDTALHLLTLFEDSDIYSDAKEHGDPTWTLGDVAEFFFQPAGRDEYFEMHTTPNNINLEIKVKSIDYFRKENASGKLTLDDIKFDINTATSVKMFSNKDIAGWGTHFEIPFEGLNMTPEELNGSRFSICRYNYTHTIEEPELSTTAPLYHPSFHAPEVWSVLKVNDND